MRIRLLAAAAVVLALSGCTSAPETPAPLPSATTPGAAAALDPTVIPADLGVVTAENAAAEGARLADALQKLIDPATILDVSDSSQLVPTDDDIAGFYGIQRTITLDPSVDPLVLAQTITAVMGQSTWKVESQTNEGGIYLAAISYGPQENFWFAFVSGDASVVGESILVLQIASPDIAG